MNELPLYEQIADKIESQITSEEYENGARLPSEQQLGEELGVSRTIVREALKLLKERGLVETRTGSGAYVTKPEAQNISDVVSRIIHLDGINYADVFKVRSILETEAAALAAKNVTEEQIQDLQMLFDNIKDRTQSNEKRAENDFLFHYHVAAASGNPLLALLVEAIGGICREVIEQSNLARNNTIDYSVSRHEKILEAIKARDSEKAVIVMKDHLDVSMKQYEDYTGMTSTEQSQAAE